MKQSKIFRKIDNGIYYFKIVEYSPNQVYSELVLQEKQKGFRQVIINSEIMIKILSKVLTKEDFVVRAIKCNRTVDKDYQEEINEICKSITSDRSELGNLIAKLAWASERNSIDVEMIDMAYKSSDNFYSIKVICNGVLSGSDPANFFDDHLLKILEENF
ncbi:hypothetical protein [Enterococcus faecium]|uniref:hypothetical protein n=1 Tax=Enterococcus faecium TaxID=1352 RepID=UPI003DA65AD0